MEQIVYLLIAGAVGGLLKSMMESNGRMVMPSIEHVKDSNGNDRHYVHLGFLMNVILGAGMGGLATDTIAAAVTTGMATAFTAEKIVEVGKARS